MTFAESYDLPFAVDLAPPFGAGDIPASTVAALPVETVPLAGLLATQASLTQTRILPIGTPTTVPVLVEQDGRRWIYDGHKRLSALAARSAPTAQARVLRLADWDEAKHPRHPSGEPDGGEFAPAGGTEEQASGIPEQAAASISAVFHDLAQPDGGFSISAVSGDHPATGFMVSTFKGREAVYKLESLRPRNLVEYAKRNFDALSQPETYFGGWHNPEDGKVYLDVSRRFENEQEADAAAKAHDQIAYFDIANGRSVPTGSRKFSDPLNGVTITGVADGEREDAETRTGRREGRAAVLRRPDGTLPQTGRPGADAGRTGGSAGSVRRTGPLGPGARLADWDEAQHPRHPSGEPDGGEFAPAGPEESTPSEDGYVYHGTNTERAREIAEHGKLVTHGPSYGTEDQTSWPDGGRQRRSYWSPKAATTRHFTPEGKPAVLRTRRADHFKNEGGTGDVYTTKHVPADSLEILGKDGIWHPLKKAMGLSDTLALADGTPMPRLLLSASARVVADGIAESLLSSAMQEKLRLLRLGWTAVEILHALLAHLGERSDGELKRIANQRTNEGFALGRATAAEQHPEQIEDATYSALLDGNTCRNCRNLDGQVFQVGSPEYEEYKPPNQHCDGLDACRCTYIYRYKPEAVA